MTTALARRAVHALVAVLAVVGALCAGLGWLYVLRDVHALGAGPGVTEALPLQRLAGEDRQPLERLLAAWIPAGLLCAFAIAAGTRLRRGTRAVIAAAGAYGLLFLTGALSDAITANERLAPHLSAQVGRGGPWIAAATFAVCALIAPPPSGAGAGWGGRAGARRSAAGGRAAA